MDTYILLSVLALPMAVQCHSWWSAVEDLIQTALLPEDSYLNIDQLANKYGYQLEEHRVLTEDDYTIKFHRIPNKTRPVVFLMHGITECSDSWLLQGPSNTLAYVLADKGFDVWLGNARGNKYSTEHAVWNYDTENFWQFTWEEIGLYDLPAMIDYILKMTNRKSLYYVGHSQGTTSGYVLLSMKPDYNKKIKVLFSMSPEAWMGNVRSDIVRKFAFVGNDVASFLDYSIYSSGERIFNKISALFCSWNPNICRAILYGLMGDEHKINGTMWPIVFGHMPTGTSRLQLLHYGQLVKSQRFCRFDHGTRNIEMYGQTDPPDYNLTNIEVPMVLFYSDNDSLSDPHDVKILMSKLPNVLDVILCGGFGHMDYVYASEARSVVYDKIIAHITNIESDK